MAVLANEKLGARDIEPGGIFKYEGGVRVNGREIAIKGDYLLDDFGDRGDPTSEERATLDSIMEIFGRAREEGTDFLEKEYAGPHYGLCDPLRSFFENAPPPK
ncbi:MAG: hypothetical protein H6862_02770 [Rhodospirillales bacterium]|nr:hypothetical protein [Rhodospirillales bacterium]